MGVNYKAVPCFFVENYDVNSSVRPAFGDAMNFFIHYTARPTIPESVDD
jgi:hypothetical protein